MSKTLLVWLTMAAFTEGIMVTMRPAGGAIVEHDCSGEVLVCVVMWPVLLGVVVGEQMKGKK